jgi:hypothetical protein
MNTQTFGSEGYDDVISADGVEFSRSELLQQLERLVASKHFRNSKRYPSLLRFVVEQTLAGNTEGLKERTLGIHVFNKSSDYDTNADPIVRVTAGEIRKRIAQYYQEPEHGHELRIDLPLGSYVPHFAAAAAHGLPVTLPDQHQEHAQPDSPQSSEEQSAVQPERARKVRRTGVALLAALLISLGVATVLISLRSLRDARRHQALTLIWRPTLASKSPALIVIGVHTLDNNGRDIPPDINADFPRDQQQSMLSAMIHSDMLPVSDLVSCSKITDLLTQHGQAYRTKGSTDTTLDELRQGPVVLIGGLDNVWTMRLTAKLRYRFLAKTAADSRIEDSQNRLIAWTFDNTQRALGNSEDYAIVASYFDPGVEQHVLIAAGIGAAGTLAASEFLTSDKYLKSWGSESKLRLDQNFELVLSTDIMDGRSGPPHVLASFSW